ncbi:MAG: Asr1405/Asl0597 family protein [Cyanobacteria bacterium J06626_4]
MISPGLPHSLLTKADMHTLDSDATILHNLDPIDRWNVFHRLQELSVPCHCTAGQPLTVTIDSPATALQVWSVIRRLTLSRSAAIASLETCWRQAVS